MFKLLFTFATSFVLIMTAQAEKIEPIENITDSQTTAEVRPEEKKTITGINGLGFAVKIGGAADLRRRTKNMPSNMGWLTGVNDFDQEPGFTLAYQQLNPGRFGFGMGLNYVRYVQDEGKYSAIRLDANLNYSFHQYFYVFAGLNTNEYISGDFGFYEKKFNPQLGQQIGIGSQVNKHLVFELNYYKMTDQFGEIDPGFDMPIVQAEFIISAIELGAYYYF
jgi:hypothetical protein